MERSFKKEVGQLRLGAGEMFSGEGILAVTKALLQSGVSYIGGYQGSPISQLLDVMVDASDLLEELGVHLETPTGEAAAAAMLAASINYPMRGAVTWKSVVGTNVGGIPELMKDEETGYLVERDNASDLIDKLTKLIDDEEKARKMGVKGKEFVTKNFNWNKICSDFLNHLKNHNIC